MTKRISRVMIRKAWVGKGLWLEFPVDGVRYRILHDKLLDIVSEVAPWLDSRSWETLGWYSTPSPSRVLLKRLRPYALEQPIN